MKRMTQREWDVTSSMKLDDKYGQKWIYHSRDGSGRVVIEQVEIIPEPVEPSVVGYVEPGGRNSKLYEESGVLIATISGTTTAKGQADLRLYQNAEKLLCELKKHLALHGIEAHREIEEIIANIDGKE